MDVEHSNHLDNLTKVLENIHADSSTTTMAHTTFPPSEKENAMRILQAMLSDPQTASLVVTDIGRTLKAERILVEKAINIAALFEEVWHSTYTQNLDDSMNPTHQPF